MYGLVNQAMRDMVIERFGAASWERIRDEAGCDDLFVTMQPYPDEVTINLVGAACRVLEAKAPDLMRMFGNYWIDYTANTFGPLFEMAGDTLVTFVRNLNNLHTRVGQMMPELAPPSFTVTDVGPDSFRLHYYSSRPGLYPMLIGLLEGLGRRFATAVEVSHVGGVNSGRDHDELLVRFQPRG